MTVSQSQFQQAIFNADQPVPEGLSDGQGATAGKRFSVYRNNVAVSLTEALRTGFPVVRKLLGDQNFDGLSGIYLRRSPPASPLMMHYGSDFPEFLERFEPLQHIGYLPDVARLELAMRASYHAADTAPVELAYVQSIPPEELMLAQLEFAPSMQIIRSRWPLYDLWAFNMKDGPKPRDVAQNVIVLRPEFDPAPRQMPAGSATFIAALQSGEALGPAHITAMQAAPDYDLNATLSLLISGNAITKVRLKENP